jgi:hypothetical protein
MFYQFKSDYEKFDIKFLQLIEKESEIITQICEEKYIHKEVTIEEVNTAIKQLNTNKAHNYFGLTLVLSEKKNLNETKNHNPALPLFQVKWSVPITSVIS